MGRWYTVHLLQDETTTLEDGSAIAARLHTCIYQGGWMNDVREISEDDYASRRLMAQKIHMQISEVMTLAMGMLVGLSEVNTMQQLTTFIDNLTEAERDARNEVDRLLDTRP
jgi:protein-arginine kinase